MDNKYQMLWSLVALAILLTLIEAFGFWPIFATYAAAFALWMLWVMIPK